VRLAKVTAKVKMQYPKESAAVDFIAATALKDPQISTAKQQIPK
jgi:hypothetical protein